jgi:hypothetical protein
VGLPSRIAFGEELTVPKLPDRRNVLRVAPIELDEGDVSAN